MMRPRYEKRFRSHHDAAVGLKKRYVVDTSSEVYLSDYLYRSRAAEKKVIYIHVPFCSQICTYCPFHKTPRFSVSEYDRLLISQMQEFARYPLSRDVIHAVNFGGGTPTSLKPGQMDNVLKAIRANFSVDTDAEVSVETTVSSLTDDMLEVLSRNRVNRLSIGVQTFHDDVRKNIGRRSSGEQAVRGIEKAVAEYGFKNTSIDLLYNYPGQTASELSYDLNIIKSLPVSGLSLYSLQVFENTPLYGKLTEKERASMENCENEFVLFSMILDSLKPLGYSLLELTKIVRDGIDKYDYMEIRHSFDKSHCFAFGDLAAGRIGAYGYQNCYDDEGRCRSISDKLRVSSRGSVVADEYGAVDAMLYQCQKGEIDFAEYSKKLNFDLYGLFLPELKQMEDQGLVTTTASGFAMTRNLGLFYGNNIIAELAELLSASVGIRNYDDPRGY